MSVEHNASEMVQLNVPAPNGHVVRQNNPANNNACKNLSYKTIVCLLVFSVVLNISLAVGLIGVKIGGHQSHDLVPPAQCHWSCPHGWLQFKGICFYFSTEERNWTSSQEFCSSVNASLAMIENEEKDSVMRYREKVPYWIGLTRLSAGQPWKWINGQNATLEPTDGGGNCAYLSHHVEAKAEAGVSRCGSEHRWICSKTPIPTGA